MCSFRKRSSSKEALKAFSHCQNGIWPSPARRLSVLSHPLAKLTASKSVDFDERIRSSADDRSACRGRRKCSSSVSPSPPPAEQVSDLGGIGPLPTLFTLSPGRGRSHIPR